MIKYTLLFLLVAGLIEGCKNESSNTPTIPGGDDVIIVDPLQANATAPPCGKPDAVCASLTDALASADIFQGTIPTIWIKSGIYDREPAYPLSVRTPLTLLAERQGDVVISSDRTVLSITAPGVAIDGVRFINTGAGDTKTILVDEGKVTFTNSEIVNNRHPADPRGTGIVVQNGGHVIFEKSAIETDGHIGVEVMDGKISLHDSRIQSASEAMLIHKNGRAELANSTFEGALFVTGGSLTLTTSTTQHISIADGGYATLTENTIQGWVSLLWKQAYANMSGNTIHGRVSAVEAKADLTNSTIYGSEEGDGVVAFNFGEFTLSHNSIFGAKHALDARPYSAIRIDQNQFDSATPGVPTIICQQDVVMTSDGNNSLRKADSVISCPGLPASPGTSLF